MAKTKNPEAIMRQRVLVFADVRAIAIGAQAELAIEMQYKCNTFWRNGGCMNPEPIFTEDPTNNAVYLANEFDAQTLITALSNFHPGYAEAFLA